MLKAAASVEEGGIMTLAAGSEPPGNIATDERPGSMHDRPGLKMKQATPITRFAYSTGSRPLDGYTIKRGVGAGGFGEVYFAVSDAGKEVALKRIQRNLDIELRGVTHCLNLKHPNLVALYDIRYDDEGQAWVVMEYVRGESLKDVVERNSEGLPIPELVDWFRGIAAGVACLHDHGIVHRDLKPGNIFLDEGVVKIGDYGLSKYISCSRRSGQTESVGTFHYMAPEIGRGVYGKEIDIYALGIILYELLTGHVPFDGESSHEIIMKHLTALPEVGTLPVKFRPIVERALFKDPTKRFKHVSEMLGAVEQGAGVSVTARAFQPAIPIAARAGETVPPVRSARAPGGSEGNDGMYFGPVQQIATAEVVPDLSRPHRGFHRGFHWGTNLGPKLAGEEPIAVAVRGGMKNFVSWWNSPALNRTARIVLAVLFVFLFFTNAGWIIPLAIVLGSAYLVYFGVRAILLSLEEGTKPVPVKQVFRAAAQPMATPFGSPLATTKPATAPVTPSAPQPRPFKAFRKKRKWQELAREQMGCKAPGERLLELTGSMLMSAVVVGVVTLLSMTVAGMPIDGSMQTWVHFAWISLVSLFGTWTLLIAAKCWEGHEGEQGHRRFMSLLLGLLVGCFGYGLTGFFGLRLTDTQLIDLPTIWTPPTGTFAVDGMPRLPAFLGYFGGIFLIVRWWMQADPLRNSRFSLGSIIITLLAAWIWQGLWPFPQPWSLAVPAAITIALQLSSTWLTTAERTQLRQCEDA